MSLQEQYDKIYPFFKTTTEPFDELEWDGENLFVISSDGYVIEKYDFNDISELLGIEITTL